MVYDEINIKATEDDGYITREADLKNVLEQKAESTATPAVGCLFPKCEDCDKYHGHYCTVPMVINKQIFLLFEDKIAQMEQRIDSIEKLVYDEILRLR